MIKATDEEYYYAINYNKLYNYISKATAHFDNEKAVKHIRWIIEMAYIDNQSNTTKQAMQDVIYNSFPRYKKLHDTIVLLQ